MIPNKLYLYPFDRIKQLSTFDKDYQNQEEKLRPFIQAWPTLSNLTDYAQGKTFDQKKRELLYEVWRDQIEALGMWEEFSGRVELIKDPTTFTVVTAHQPVLFGGPLYTVYKALSCVALARSIEEANPELSVLPTYVIGGEDHDVDEMNHTYLYGKRVSWDTTQTGATGRFNLEGISEVIELVENILGDKGVDLVALLKNSFTPGVSYGQAYHKFWQTLLTDTGLIVLRMDDRRLKQSFRSIIEREIFDQVSKPLVEATQSKLSHLGYDNQAYCRYVNFFYLKDGDRVQINPVENDFEVGGKEISQEEMKKLLDDHIENFSPNVIMRPIYQEYSLPNLAYIGGGGELAYWKERKEQFTAFDLNMPILVRRDSVAYLDDFIIRRMEKSSLSLDELLEDQDVVIKEKISSEIVVDDYIEEQKKKILQEFEIIRQRASEFDAGLSKYVAAEAKKLENTIHNLEQKIIRSAKKNSSDRVNQIERCFDHLYPNGSLQERRENFMSYYAKYGQSWIELLQQHINPLDPHFKIIAESDKDL